MKIKERNYVFTFGDGQPNAGHYVKIRGTYVTAREKMFELFGENWAFQYDEDSYNKFFAEHPEIPKEKELKLHNEEDTNATL